jgi:plasmid stabilization system protein ParE
VTDARPTRRRITAGVCRSEVIAMPQKAWSDKRERQYEHIKESYEDRGVGRDEAEERAARTVNKERAEHGETKSSRKR